jgi:quinoprotein glucose dehydrogenase
MYFSEWGEGWEGTGRGRLFKMEHAEALQHQASQVAEVKKLLGEGFKQRSSEELAKLLAHPDQRVRLRAQWALADRAVAKKGTPDGDQTGKLMMKIALDGVEGPQRQLSRLHAIWGLGQAGRQLLRAAHPDGDIEIPAPKPNEPLLCSDADPEIRAQALAIVGELPGRLSPALSKIVAEKLSDPSLRVRFFAANALANHGDTTALPAVLAMLRENADKDQYLRHAGVGVLTKCRPDQLAAAAKDESRSVRLAALLALRRLEKPEVAQFLADKDPLLVKEAARAINDAPVVTAYGDLAKLIATPNTDEQFMIRVINANFRAGAPANAQALVAYAANDTSPQALRVEALKALATWPKPFPRDRVVGIFRPLGERDGAPAIAAVRGALPQLLNAKSAPVALATIEAVSTLGVKDAAPALLALMARPEVAAKVRAQALEAIADFDDPKLAQAIKLAVADKDPALRVKASAMLGKLDPEAAAAQLATAFADAAIPEKKSVITALAGLKSAAADQALASLLDGLAAGNIPTEVQLELLEAAAQRTAPVVKAKLAAYNANLPKSDPLAAFAPTLVGGNKDEGERLFKEHAVAACLRCHKVSGSGGDAGPDLTGIGAKKDRRYLLESIVLPNAAIADGFQSVMVTLKDGSIQAGVVKAETDRELTLQMPVPDAPAIKVAKAEIKSRENAPSGMIPGLGDLLTKREIRDLVEYVASLR